MAETYGHEPQYRTVRWRGFSGVRDDVESTLIEDGESPNALNIEFDRSSIATTRGCRKFGNQIAPDSAVRMRADSSLPPLKIESGKSVPLRGSGYLPYSTDYDFGGREDFEGTFPTTDSYHVRRGIDFEVGASFHWPDDQKLYEADTRGASAPAAGSEAATYNPPHGFDEALDACCCILQKGGDRTAPMSWALAIVNVGKLNSTDATIVTLPTTRPSNYALCWIWLDAPSWGEISPASMMYNLTSGFLPTDTANGGQYSTQALRAIVLHKFVEPGVDYSVRVQCHLDTGSQGAIAANTAWNHDGYFKVYVRDGRSGALEQFTFVDDSAGGVATGMEVWKGPQDSIRYFSKYGVRFFGRDAMFVGHGYRFIPWREGGFIPFGMDSAPLENGGFRMLDRSAAAIASIYPGGYTLTATKTTAPQAYLEINHGGFSDGNNLNGVDPMATFTGAYQKWLGCGNAAGTVPHNTESLRGYRLVTTFDFNIGAPNSKGAIFSILSYARNGAADFRATIEAGSTIGVFAARPVLIQAFRWHQVELRIGWVVICGAARNYVEDSTSQTARRRWSIGRGLRLDDATEPEIASVRAVWPMDDAGGTVLRELVVGGIRSGHLIPMGCGVVKDGESNKLFLSGEGEALVLDLSDNPVAKREIENLLRSTSQGFAIQISCVFTEAFYAIQGVPETLPDSGGLLTGSRGRFVPEILGWDTKDADATGEHSRPKPLISLTHRGLHHDAGNAKFQRPMGFCVEVAHKTDQDNIEPIVPSALLDWYLGAGAVETSRYDTSAPWVGKRVTIQIGIQSTGLGDQYDVYIAMSPKDAFNPQSGDPGDAEFAYWTDGTTVYDASVSAYFTAAHLTISRKDLMRSVITIGGKWRPGTLGYCELNARMLVGEIRFFPGAAPGALPTVSGGIVTSRDGKLEGGRALPARVLEKNEILLPLGRDLRTVNVTERSQTVGASGSGRFFLSASRDTVEAVKDCFIMVDGDEALVPDDETLFVKTADFHRVSAVAADGSTLTLQTAYNQSTRVNARASLLRLLFYSALQDALIDRPISLGSRTAYNPGVSTTADIQLTQPFFANVLGITSGLRLRVFSPGVPSASTLPTWGRGVAIPRRGKTGEGVLGVASVNERMYAAVRGAVYEADDRWRAHGPLETIPASLAFLPRRNPPPALAGLVIPSEGDRVEFESYSGALLDHGSSDANVTFYDAWIDCEEVSEYQTVLWIGDTETDPSLLAGTTGRTNRIYMILRLNRGRPELVFGSTAFYTGTTQPEKGLFIARGSGPIERGSDVHIRWYLETRASGTILRIPYLKVNGKKVAVTVNARDNDASITAATDWLRVSTLIPMGRNARLLLGASRDSYRAPGFSVSLASMGTQIAPQRLHGFLHGLAGELAELVIGQEAKWTSVEPPDIDPYTLTYAAATLRWRVLGASAEGRGHKVKELISPSYGIIRSHPFITISNELGLSDDPASFARYGQQLYVANNCRPVLVQNDKGKPAGLEPPVTTLDFELTRFPIWTPNVRNKLSAATPENDPIDGAPTGTTPLIYHYRDEANTFLEATLAAADATKMQWDPLDVFAFKAYLRPKSLFGRQRLFSKGISGKEGGPFIELRDGHLWIGWFDITTKRDVWLRTSAPVMLETFVHYLYARKQWPQGDAIEGNWCNSYFTNGTLRRMTVTALAGGSFAIGNVIRNGASTKQGVVIKAYAANAGAATQVIEYVLTVGVEFATEAINNGGGVTATSASAANTFRPMHDSLVIRKFPKQVGAIYDPLDAKIAGGFTELAAHPGNPTDRAIVSLTTDLNLQPAGTSCTGMVTIPGATFSGTAVPGQVLARHVNPLGGVVALPIFAPDMVGMYFQWGSGSGLAATVYRIVGWTSVSDITVANLDGTAAAAFGAGVVAQPAAVFSGVSLVKDSFFDSALMPDTSPGVIEMFGASLARDTLSGFAPFQGDFWCPGYAMTALSANGEYAAAAAPADTLFETRDTTRATGALTDDPIYVGTDRFVVGIYDGLGGQCDELRGDNLRQVWCADFQTYAGVALKASSQPNTTRKIAADTVPTCSAAAGSDPIFQFLQDPDVWQQTNYFAVAFFDPEQGVVSNPGPVLQVKPLVEDGLNPSGAVRALLKSLPVSRDPGPLLDLYIFKSLSTTNPDGSLLEAGSSAVQTRVAIVPSGTDQVGVRGQESFFAVGPLLEFDNGPPPVCRILATAQSRLFYGALEEQADGVSFSKAFLPVQVPALNFFRINVGPGDRVVGMAELNGVLVCLMRESAFGVAVSAAGATQKIITSGSGCVAPQSVFALDNDLLWCGDRGVYALRSTAENFDLGETFWVGRKIKQFFATRVDRRDLFRAGSGINRARHAYHLAHKLAGERLTDSRVAFYGEGFGLMRAPNVTALASVQPADGGPPRLIGGTEEGFMAWLDDDGTQLLLLGTDEAAYGSPLLVALANTDAAALAVTGALDSALEGPRGSVVRWQVGNVDYQATVLGSDGTFLFLDAPVEVLPEEDGVVTLGAQAHRWESRWTDLGNFEKRKKVTSVDLEFSPGSSGRISVIVYGDRSDTNIIGAKLNLPVSGAKLSIPLPSAANWFKLVVVSTPLTAGSKLEITGVTWRGIETDQA